MDFLPKQLARNHIESVRRLAVNETAPNRRHEKEILITADLLQNFFSSHHSRTGQSPL